MKLPFEKIKDSRKLENSIFFAIVLFVFKVISPNSTSAIELVINEFLLLGLTYFLILYLSSVVKNKANNPLSLILNTGILTALLFFIITVSSSLYEDPYELPLATNFMAAIVYILTCLIIVFIVSYIFTVFRELYFLRQKRDSRNIFNFMIWFFILASISFTILTLDGSKEYFFNAFLVVSIILILFNSLRVSWIAFLVKKQKMQLLVISVVLSILFSVNFAHSLRDMIFNQTLVFFSPAFSAFLNIMMIYGSIYFGVLFFTTLFHLPTAEVFDRKAEEASTLMDLSKLITQVFDFKELAETVTNITTKVCYSDSAWLMIDKNGEFEIISTTNISLQNAKTLTNEIGIENLTLITDVKIINPSNLLNTNLGENSSFKSFAVAPLKIHNEVQGYLFAGRSEDFGFDEDDKKNIDAYADYAALALENAKLIEESLEKERLEKELDVAREIQYKILPHETPKCEHLDITAVFIPAFEVGGDYYDFFKLGNKKLGFVIADVSGKGIPAAFIMAEIKGVFSSLAKWVDSPAELLKKANTILAESLDKKTFVTAIYGIVDVETGVVKYARAGHTPLLHFTDGKVHNLIPKGLGLGLAAGKGFDPNIEEMEIKLNNNDILVLYTDGIPESQNSELEDFGFDRLEEIVVNNASAPTNTLSNEIIKQVSTFSTNNSQHDDITLVIFKWKNINNTGVI